jgi:hypothetical protein
VVPLQRKNFAQARQLNAEEKREEKRFQKF